MRNLTTVAEVVADIIENMSESEKENIADTPEEDLIMFHHGWGTGIRNHYNLWQNKALVQATGKEHADDASNVIKSVFMGIGETEDVR